MTEAVTKAEGRSESLADWLDAAPLPPGIVITLGQELALKLASYHEAHGRRFDLTPDRVRVVEQPGGRPEVLLDGDSAASVPDREIQSELPQVALPHVAPEIMAEGRADERADAYALGVILYHALCAEEPFEGPSAIARLKSKLASDVRPPSERNSALSIPAALDRLVLALLAVDPGHRPGVAGAADALAAIDSELRDALRDEVVNEARDDSETDTDSETETETETETDSETETETDSETETETETDSDSDDEVPDDLAAWPPRDQARESDMSSLFFAEGERLAEAAHATAEEDQEYEAPPSSWRTSRWTVAGAVAIIPLVALAAGLLHSTSTTSAPSAPIAALSQDASPEADSLSMAAPEAAAADLATAQTDDPAIATPAVAAPVEEPATVESAPVIAAPVETATVESAPAIAAPAKSATRASASPPAPRAQRLVKSSPPPLPEENRATAADPLSEAKAHRAAGRNADAYRGYFRAATSGERALAASGRLGMAEMALRLKRFSEARTEARRALDLGASSTRAWRVIGEASCHLGERDAARDALTRAGGGSCD